jgi:hypothetical protein
VQWREIIKDKNRKEKKIKTAPVPDKSGKVLIKFHSDFTFATWYILHIVTGMIISSREDL